jgi:hypothetical protein
MPMIDVYAAAGTFDDPRGLARALAAAVVQTEGVPDIAMFRQNTAAYVHELPGTAFSNADGESGYVRVQVLTNAGALDRDKQLRMVSCLTALVTAAPGRPPQPDHVWVLLTEAPDGGWGLWGHAYTNAELVDAVRARLAGGAGESDPTR